MAFTTIMVDTAIQNDHYLKTDVCMFMCASRCNLNNFNNNMSSQYTQFITVIIAIIYTVIESEIRFRCLHLIIFFWEIIWDWEKEKKREGEREGKRDGQRENERNQQTYKSNVRELRSITITLDDTILMRKYRVVRLINIHMFRVLWTSGGIPRLYQELFKLRKDYWWRCEWMRWSIKYHKG